MQGVGREARWPALLAACALAACSPIAIDKRADHMATLLFTGLDAADGAIGGAKLALLRSAGDELTVVALTPEPDLTELGPLLAERGLARIQALVLALPPAAIPRLPSGIDVRTTYAPAGATCPGAAIVAAPMVLRLSGLEIGLSPCGGDGGARGIAVEIRHGGNRMLLVPDVAGAANEIAKRAGTGSGRVDLLGVVSRGTLDSLRDVGSLERAQVVLADAGRGSGPFDTVSLADSRRVLFQSEEGHRPVRIDAAGRTP